MRVEAGANCCLSETRIARPRGLEPLTNRVETGCSIHWATGACGVSGA